MNHQGYCNCDAAGGAQAKTGEMREPLDRAMGLMEAASAMMSKTRSGHPATKTNNKWMEPQVQFGDGDHVVGYGKGNSY